VQVVLASGEIVEANASANQNLYAALCGGGNNFGIITRFDLQAFTQPNISVSSRTMEISYRQQLFEAFTELVNSDPFDKYASLVTSLSFNSTTKHWSMSTSSVYTQPVLYPEVFENITSIPSTTNKTYLTSLASFADERRPPFV
jgi:hypothetical protein